MPEPLLALVNECLLPTVEPLGFKVVQSEVAISFENAMVTLEAPDLRVRIVRERSQVFADFGAVAAPDSWFDSAVIIDYLGLSAAAGFHDRNARVVLRGVASFVLAFHPELAEKFSQPTLAKTTAALAALKNARASASYGF
jgi:hypothetical protein